MANSFNELSIIYEPSNFEYLILILSPVFHLLSICLNSYPTLLAGIQTFLSWLQNSNFPFLAKTVPSNSPASPECQCQQKTAEAIEIILKIVLQNEWECQEKLKNEIETLQEKVKELEAKRFKSSTLNRKQKRFLQFGPPKSEQPVQQQQQQQQPQPVHQPQQQQQPQSHLLAPPPTPEHLCNNLLYGEMCNCDGRQIEKYWKEKEKQNRIKMDMIYKCKLLEVQSNSKKQASRPSFVRFEDRQKGFSCEDSGVNSLGSFSPSSCSSTSCSSTDSCPI